jgi:hypothetical protein
MFTRCFRRFLRANVFAVAIAGCDNYTRDAQTVQAGRATLDTIGDTIVARSSGAGTWGDSIKLVEELRIGRTDSADQYSFGFVRDMAVGQNGTIYVADLKARNVRSYDSAGNFIRQIGRSGKGPGEYQGLIGITLTSDEKLLTCDAMLNRINVYSKDGEFERDLSWKSGVHSMMTDAVRISSVSDIYIRTFAGMPARGGFPPSTFLRIDSTGTIRDTVSPAPGPSAIEVPYEPHGLITLNSKGDAIVGFTGRYAIDVRSANGKVFRIERTGTQPLSVSQEERHYEDSVAAARFVSMGRTTGPSKNVPASKPFLQGLSTGADDRVWIQLHTPSAERKDTGEVFPNGQKPDRWYEPTKSWDIFEPDGTYLGRVTLPNTADIFYRRGPHIWGIAEDENGNTFVVRWRMEPQRK